MASSMHCLKGLTAGGRWEERCWGSCVHVLVPILCYPNQIRSNYFCIWLAYEVNIFNMILTVAFLRHTCQATTFLKQMGSLTLASFWQNGRHKFSSCSFLECLMFNVIYRAHNTRTGPVLANNAESRTARHSEVRATGHGMLILSQGLQRSVQTKKRGW